MKRNGRAPSPTTGSSWKRRAERNPLTDRISSRWASYQRLKSSSGTPGGGCETTMCRPSITEIIYDFVDMWNGTVGVWSRELRYSADRADARDAAAELEQLGYAALWI